MTLHERLGQAARERNLRASSIGPCVFAERLVTGCCDRGRGAHRRAGHRGDLGITGFSEAHDVPPLQTLRENRRWLDGLYLDEPDIEDDPYRYFRW